MRRLMTLFLAAALLMPLLASAEGMPAWEYPLAPEILRDVDQYLTLTNRKTLLDKKYVPEDLVRMSVRSTVDDPLRREANEALMEMFLAAEEAGYTLYVKSGYRSYQTQRTMYNNRLEKNHGRDDGLVAYPGSSDHQTGLGVDILNYEWTQKDGMNYRFAATAEAQWMDAHCQEYGFILRYMEDKEDVTGIKFEPWHFRYVGREAAAYIMENHLSLEEFTEEWQAYLAGWEAAGGDFLRLLHDRARLNPVTVSGVGDDGEEELSIYY